MNKYNAPLVAPITQTILPAMNESGILYGWYPIDQTEFDGTETSFDLVDTTVPLKVVTQDSGHGLPQYMAAVFPLGIANNYKPWASSTLIAPDSGYFRWFSQPTETWMLHYGAGALIEGLLVSLDNSGVTAPATPGVPTVTTPLALTWKASVAYEMLTKCPFFDFNWVTLFKAKANTNSGNNAPEPVRIEVVSNPAGNHLVASVIGIPVATANGSLFDTIRIMRMEEEVAAGSYAFTFRIYDSLGQYTAATLNLTVQ